MLRLVALFLICSASLAQAEEFCNSRELARLDANLPGSHLLSMPATFAGRQTRLVLITGGRSELRERFVTALELRPLRMSGPAYRGVAGDKATHHVIVPLFQLGTFDLRQVDFLVSRDNYAEPIDRFAGSLGVERLGDFDVEIDGATKTVTLHQPDIFCSGRLVRWADKWAEIPFNLNNNVPELRAEIDGVPMDAVFDTSASHTIMSLDVARRSFGITPSSPGVRRMGEQSIGGGNELPLYIYRFKALTIGGLTFNDAAIVLGEFEDTELTLGMRQISQLHSYIAFKRKMIYATRIEGK